MTASGPSSPLWMVTQAPALNGFVADLRRQIEGLRQDAPQSTKALFFSRAKVSAARADFAAMILKGERRLHRLCQLFACELFSTYQLQSVVFGEIDSTGERFVLSQGLQPEELDHISDLDLGTRQLSRLEFKTPYGPSKASLVANVVEYQPTAPNPWHVHRLISRIKAEEEIWNKVVDELFDLDSLVKRDKQISHLSYYIKDVFGLKLVVETVDDVRRLHHGLRNMVWSDAALARIGLSGEASRSRLEFVETKDYMGGELQKASGWEAIKSVVRWADKTFEIQVQPLARFYNEREFLTRESHEGFKARRETLRNKVAEEIPLFGLCRDVLRWLFVAEAALPAPGFGPIEVVIEP